MPECSEGPETPSWVPAAVAAVLAPAFLAKVRDADVWWHLATGRWIAHNGRLPTEDPFTYTMRGKPWHLVNGLGDLIFFGAYRMGGVNALVVLKAVFAFSTLALVGLCLREVKATRGGVVGLLVAIAVLLHARYTMDRPLIVGASLLAACELAVLRSHRRHDRSHFFFLIALPLWPLVHATALLGLGQLAALLLAGLIARAPRKHLVSVAATLAVCGASTAVLPWWRDTFVVATHLTGGATATLFTAEWLPGIDAVPYRLGHWAVVAMALAGGARRVRQDASLLLLTLLAAAISLRFARNAYEGIILAAPACACALGDAREVLQARGRAALGDAIVPGAALAIAAVQLAIAPSRTVGGPLGFGMVEQLFPSDTLATLRRLPVHRLFNSFPIGGFLIWQDTPYGVYCDGRTVALYTERDVQALFAPTIESGRTLTATADAWNAPYGLNEHLSPPNQWMMVSPDWVPVHIGLGTALFVRATHLAELPPDVPPLHLVRYSSDARWTEGWYAGIVKDAPLSAQLDREFAVAARLSPDSPTLVDIVRAVAAVSPDHAAPLEASLIEARRMAAR
jgi:hypothetical protein